MPPLKRVKHEQFARLLTEESTQKEAYLKTYPNASPDTARSNSSALLALHDVRERFFELLKEKQADLSTISDRYAHFLKSDKHPQQSWDAVKTGLKIYEILDAPVDNSANMQNIQINITNLSSDSNK